MTCSPAAVRALLVAAVFAAASAVAPASAQDAPSPQAPAPQTLQAYQIISVSVEGAADESSQALARTVSGLRPGQSVQLPWDPAFGEAVRNLYSRGWYTDVRIEATEFTPDGVFLTIHVEEQPKLARYEIDGLKSSARDDLKDEIPLLAGRSVRDADVERGRMAIQEYLRGKGFRLATVGVSRQLEDDGRVALTYTVDRGERVTVADVRFEGNEAFSEGTLRKQLSNTPERRWWRFWKRETFDDAAFDEDLAALVRFYNDRGYYGARVVRDSVYVSDDPETGGLVVEVEVDEGDKYHIRDVVFEGNTVLTDDQLALALGIQKGDVYDRTRMEKSLYYSQDNSDISSLYQDQGYLRFNIEPEIVEVPGDSLDLYFEVTEGEVYEFGDVRIAGNTRTKEHVIRREIRTVPGQPFSRAAIQRSVRELATLNYFDPASFGNGPSTSVNDENKTVDLVYNLSETSSDQLELSGGWGGGNIGLILTARVTFTNFSVQNLMKGFDGGMPTGDGQQLSLQVQTYGQRQQIYSLSFTEPWFRGRQTPAGFALSYSRYAFNDRRYGTISARAFYRQRLKWPDDYFLTGTDVGYRLYDVEGLNSPFLPDGVSQELTLSQSISRNALDNPTFPTAGSNIDLSVTVAPPIGDFVQYHKWDFNTAWYTPVAGPLSASFRSRFGYIGTLTGDEVRFQRYLIGGTPLEASGTSGIGRGFGRDLVFLRGYPLEAIGPRREGEPVGGRILNKYEAELSAVLLQTPQLSFAPYLFADAANAYDGFGDYDPSRLYRSVGVGSRIFLPILGLVDLSMGYQLDSFEAIDGSGQIEEPQWRFQFSLGGR